MAVSSVARVPVRHVVMGPAVVGTEASEHIDRTAEAILHAQARAETAKPAEEALRRALEARMSTWEALHESGESPDTAAESRRVMDQIIVEHGCTHASALGALAEILAQRKPGLLGLLYHDISGRQANPDHTQRIREFATENGMDPDWLQNVFAGFSAFHMTDFRNLEDILKRGVVSPENPTNLPGAWASIRRPELRYGDDGVCFGPEGVFGQVDHTLEEVSCADSAPWVCFPAIPATGIRAVSVDRARLPGLLAALGPSAKNRVPAVITTEMACLGIQNVLSDRVPRHIPSGVPPIPPSMVPRDALSRAQSIAGYFGRHSSEWDG